MNKINKKVLLTIGTSITIAAPLATVVACGVDEPSQDLLDLWGQAADWRRVYALEANSTLVKPTTEGFATLLQTTTFGKLIERLGLVPPTGETFALRTGFDLEILGTASTTSSQEITLKFSKGDDTFNQKFTINWLVLTAATVAQLDAEVNRVGALGQNIVNFANVTLIDSQFDAEVTATSGATTPVTKELTATIMESFGITIVNRDNTKFIYNYSVVKSSLGNYTVSITVTAATGAATPTNTTSKLDLNVKALLGRAINDYVENSTSVVTTDNSNVTLTMKTDASDASYVTKYQFQLLDSNDVALTAKVTGVAGSTLVLPLTMALTADLTGVKLVLTKLITETGEVKVAFQADKIENITLTYTA